ncbi:unnamed protein product [Nippostrongylus brasiliensis]|uniref:DUF3800 domain-containing protein n=1 Tax=Nippostrongylus brasiliensis TaxID=27835 RepID=A0A0N4XGV8_NIPBR|nr:unnamed protein product [Nippostrongylus brasiliensis]
MPIIVVSSSGSMRTVDVVASAALRMLMFDEKPGNAVRANSSFYDFETTEFHCEDRSEEFLKVLEEVHNITCSPLSNKTYHMDRVAMVIRRQQPKGGLLGAYDNRGHDFNYPAGF